MGVGLRDDPGLAVDEHGRKVHERIGDGVHGRLHGDHLLALHAFVQRLDNLLGLILGALVHRFLRVAVAARVNLVPRVGRVGEFCCRPEHRAGDQIVQLAMGSRRARAREVEVQIGDVADATRETLLDKAIAVVRAVVSPLLLDERHGDGKVGECCRRHEREGNECETSHLVPLEELTH